MKVLIEKKPFGIDVEKREIIALAIEVTIKYVGLWNMITKIVIKVMPENIQWLWCNGDSVNWFNIVAVLVG